MKLPRSSSSCSRTSAGRNGTPWVKPVAQTTRSAGSVVPSDSSAEGLPSTTSSRVDGAVPVDGDVARLDALEEALGGQADRAAHDVLHRARGHQAEPLEPELPHRHRADGVDHPAAQAVAGAVQELLEAAQAEVPEQRLAHPGEQQHLEVEHAADLARHLPQQLAGDHVGARGDLADRHGHVAGRLAVADDEHVLVPGLLGVVELGARAHLAAGRGELRQAVELGTAGSQNTPLATTSRS
jgi:hypothetical protein